MFRSTVDQRHRIVESDSRLQLYELSFLPAHGEGVPAGNPYASQ